MSNTTEHAPLISANTPLWRDPWKSALALPELIHFCRELHLAYKSNHALPNTLQKLANTSKHAAYQQALLRIAQEVTENKHELSQALAHQNRFFPSIMVHILQIAEESGNEAAAFNHYGAKRLFKTIKIICALHSVSATRKPIWSMHFYRQNRAKENHFCQSVLK